MKSHLSLVFFLLSFLAGNAQNKKPNIIVFLVDDMGWQDCSVPFGNKVTPLNQTYRTPNMERMAAQGMKFTNAYANPVCTPTRVSLMTGMNVARHGVTNWTSPQKNSPSGAPDSVLVPVNWNHNGMSPVPGVEHTVVATPLPQLLKQAGYTTIHCGKAHFASYGTPAADPLNIGFDINIAGTAAGHPGSYLGSDKYRYNEKDTTWGVRGLDKYAAEGLFLTEALTREAMVKLKENEKSGKPFFLYMAHYAVHVPLSKDERFYQAYIDRGLNDTEARYAALVEGMDKSLGDLMDFLEREKLADNTYILFMSDNGGLSLVPPRSGEVHTQNLPLKQGKGSLYEGGIRVPMLVKGPGIAPGSLAKQYVVVEDFFPTLLAMTGMKGFEKVQTVDGKNFLPLLHNPKKSDDGKVLVWHYPNNWTNRYFHGTAWGSAIRQGPWKLIYFHRDGNLELYNLDEDIGEHNNLAKAQPDRVRRMAKLLTSTLQERGATMPTVKATGKTIPWPDEVAVQ